MNVNDQLLGAGLRRVVQVQEGTNSDWLGRPVISWCDTEWTSIEKAREFHGDHVFRNAIVADNDEPFEEPQAVESAMSVQDAKDIFESVQEDMEKAGIPSSSRFISTPEASSDCGCGLGKACRFSQ